MMEKKQSHESLSDSCEITLVWQSQTLLVELTNWLNVCLPRIVPKMSGRTLINVCIT